MGTFFARYLDSLFSVPRHGEAAYRSTPRGIARSGYTFWERYLASLTRTRLPPHPALAAQTATAPVEAPEMSPRNNGQPTPSRTNGHRPSRNQVQPAWPRHSAPRLAGELSAKMLWLAGALILVLGGGAVVTAITLHHHSPSTPPKTVVLKKLTALGEYNAAQRRFAFNVTDVVHQSFLFFTGESINVVGSGTDDALVNFAGLTENLLDSNGTSISVVLPPAHLGKPAVDLNQTTVSETGGLFTHISHLFSSHPNDATYALELAQRRIGADAARSDLISVAQAHTRAFLTQLLRRLGFTHVTVSFV